MTKLIIEINYRKYVLDAKDALSIVEILGKAEKYTYEYEGKIHRVWSEGLADTPITLSVLPDDTYRMAKAAGAPQKD
ncbi:hypothetical protein UFOVP1058_64 [uncultured Caudovirales phage]|uniref:Uncharacterized protein n=1 Tax=uncultured Caudovirales phage TaxID=2100421 RepID=A0A6J5T2F2_9CAUD|nr:hypothetical protein UFOVP656_16 [uncultured Caudovirales phage]CAB4167667.1 hypothetical protein UFOVP857_38 [uncultured Caudovirales phage]CAB4168365.1 hypothetical protein UFOVP879_8 [uncultured Caudovirales phage]CAB4181778.1 hypothetical protein UFOVP1058_64 [uncultured Caudovirales phage]CAB4195404.1 hypothetical protein UFOVP1289_19 [uncultured Caudovirales phage]